MLVQLILMTFMLRVINSLDSVNYVNVTSNGLFGNHRKDFSECGVVYKNLMQTVIQSPGYPTPYSRQLDCEYEVKAPYICSNEFHVQFLNFSVAVSPNCEKNRILVNYSDAFCGRVNGFRKFKTDTGRLKIQVKFTEGKNVFKLLVTQLPCLEENLEDLEMTTIPQESTDPTCFYRVNASYSVGDQKVNERQDIPVIPLPPFVPPGNIPPTAVPPFLPPTNFPPGVLPPILPPQFPGLPQCCRNVFRQPRFILISQSFPSYTSRNEDCVYQIQRASPNVCRIRIIFKYFLIDQDQFGCGQSFIEIDGQRICGCKNGFVYESQWGMQPKFIRLRTLAARHRDPQGFIFDVIQEPCPYRLTAPKINEIELFETREGARAKFFTPNNLPGVCVFNLMTLFQLKMDTLLIPKEICYPVFYL